MIHLWLILLGASWACFYLHVFPGWFDSAELSLGAFSLGITHPPGQPFFTLVAKPFTWIPVGSIAFRTALFSMTCFSAGVFFSASALQRRMDGSWSRPFVTSLFVLSLFLNPDLGLQVSRTEVYALCFLFLSVILWISSYAQETCDARWLYLAMFTWGGFLATHPVIALSSFPALVTVFYPTAWSKKAISGCFVMLGLSCYLYLPLRAITGPELNWGDPANYERLVHTLFALDYRSFHVPSLSAFETLGLVLNRLGPLQTVFLMGGLVSLTFSRRWVWLSALLGICALSLVCACLTGVYRQNPDSYGYFVPFFLAAHMLAFIGLQGGLTLLPRRSYGVAVLFLTGGSMVALSFAPAVSSLGSHGGEIVSTWSHVYTVSPAHSAHFLSSDHWIFPAWYRKGVENQRPESSIVARGLLGAKWYQKNLEAALPSQPFRISELSDPNAFGLHRLLFETGLWEKTTDGCMRSSPHDTWKFTEGLCTQVALNILNDFYQRQEYIAALVFLEKTLGFPVPKRERRCPRLKQVSLPFKLKSRTEKVFLPNRSFLRNEYLLLALGCDAGVSTEVLRSWPDETEDDRSWKRTLQK